jgi:cyclohexadienyl dehydratase
MQKALLVAVLGVLGLATQPVGAQQASHLEQILEAGVLRVGTTGDFNPMSFRDPATNEYDGFDIDVAKQLAADMEVEIEFVPTDWKTLINGIVADKYDISTSASLNLQRAKVAGYSAAYVEFGTVPMTLKDNLDQFDGWDSINDADIAVAVTLVLAKRALVSITSNVEAASLIKTYPELTVIPVDKARSRRPGAFLLAQEDQVWINYVNHWIELKHTQGFFEQLGEKWGLPQ